MIESIACDVNYALNQLQRFAIKTDAVQRAIDALERVQENLKVLNESNEINAAS